MELDPLDLQAAEDRKKQRQEAAQLEVLRNAEDIKWLLSSKRGRRIVFRLLQDAGVYRSSFNTNALQMSFNEGNRNAGLMLLAVITEHASERYAEMIEESKQ
ncbi:Bbp19 family protein [Pseudomonas sp.]|uniref:Bbp19 family protein n=1 Tax=Pseudomonas sp. TaxID=306 RepID=UPI003FD7B680